MTLNGLYKKAHEQFKEENYDEALKLVEELKKLAPNWKIPYVLESQIFRGQMNFVRERLVLEKLFVSFDLRILEEKSMAAEVLYALGQTYYRLAMPQEAIKILCLSAQLASNDAFACQALSGAIFAASYAENFSVKDYLVLYAKYKKHLAGIKPYPLPDKPYVHEKIRVGFLSSVFQNNVATQWSWTLLNNFDKDLFTVYCYSSTRKPDEITEYLIKNVDVWRDISGFKEEAAAELIHNDEIDILFDLMLHIPNNLLRIAAYKPAPVQISGVGYVSSTGLDFFDYFLSDIYCANESDQYFIEKPIRLPHSHFCYTPLNEIEVADSPPCVKKNYVTFGCFNRFGKITDSILRAWKKIMDAVPESRLLLKTMILNTEDGKNFVAERLKRFNFDLSRVEMRKTSVDYLREYADVDIALDTYPYTGGVTTCEALYMGVPVVSLYGERHGTRFGLSILKNIGLGELAVNSYDDYVARAVALADDKELLTILRKALRGMMKNSPLMNSEIYIRDVEEAFIKILLEKRKKYS